MRLNQRNWRRERLLREETEEERVREREAVIHNWPTEGAVDSGQCKAAAAAQPLQFSNVSVRAHVAGFAQSNLTCSDFFVYLFVCLIRRSLGCFPRLLVTPRAPSGGRAEQQYGNAQGDQQAHTTSLNQSHRKT